MIHWYVPRPLPTLQDPCLYWVFDKASLSVLRCAEYITVCNTASQDIVVVDNLRACTVIYSGILYTRHILQNILSYTLIYLLVQGLRILRDKKHGTYHYVLVCTLYILVYTSWTSCTFSVEGGSIVMLWYHHILVPPHPVSLCTGQRQRNVCSFSFMKALFKPVLVCTRHVPVHMHTDHTHTSFPIRPTLPPQRLPWVLGWATNAPQRCWRKPSHTWHHLGLFYDSQS